MNVIDIILSIFLLLGFVRGFFKGFLLELSGLVALIAGVYGSIHFSGGTKAFLAAFISWEDQYLSLLAFAVTFITIVVIISLIARILTKMVSMLALGIVNRILGAVFGLVKMAFLASVLFLLLERTEAALIEPESRENSVLYSPVARIAPLILPAIIEEVKEGDLFETPEEEN